MSRGIRRLGGSRVRRMLRAAVYLAVAGIVVIAAYAVFVGVRRTQPITLPVPAGGRHVGRATFDWTDTTRRDLYAPSPVTARTVSVWVWYPAAPGAVAASGQYAPGAWSGLSFAGPAAFLEGPLATVRPHAVDGPPAARGRFPIIVLEPGMGLAAPEFTALAEGIASEGYIVAGVTPTYSANLTVIDGRAVRSTAGGNPPDLGSQTATALENADVLLTTWAADATFAAARVRILDRSGPLAGHVGVGPITYVGHSFGGAAALQACVDDPQCAGAVDIDGTQFGPVVRTGMRRPFLILGSDNSCVLGSCKPKDADDRSELVTAQRFLAASTGQPYRYSITGTKHFNFTDISVWYVAPPVRQLFPLGSIDGHRGLVLEEAVVTAFLARTHGAGQSDLEALTVRYPEVRRLS